MRILSFHAGERVLPGVLTPDGVADISGLFRTTRDLLAEGPSGLAAVRAYLAGSGKRIPLDEVRLAPPVPHARKLFALAGNYDEHVREGGRPTYPKEETYPYFFMKPPSTTLVGSGADVPVPSIARKLDYEGELCIVIGRQVRSVPAGSAADAVAGYTVLNDLSERSLASKDPPRAARERDKFFDWLVGKWFDSAAPCGPWMVTSDELPDPHALRLTTRVNGELRQDASTADMVFTVPEVISFISRVVTLEPGDLIATGTPSGVGSARGVFLGAGDLVEVEIEGIGQLRNRLVAPELQNGTE